MRGLIAIAAALAVAAGPAPARTDPASAGEAVSAAGIPVREDGLVATWYPPRSGIRGPVVLALGGSEGGERGGQLLGEALARHGYGALALTYHNADGLPRAVEELPLEYFDRALAWLRRQPLADPDRIGVYGISVGGETALVLGARDPRIRAVVAVVPSSVVFQGINMRDWSSVRSTYSSEGRPVPFVPYDTSGPFTSILDLYHRSLARRDSHPDAIIPVERIGGPVLLVSGGSDGLWPSALMSEQVIERLRAAGFTHRYEHLTYADAGHGAFLPPDDGPPRAPPPALGGTPEGNAAARADMWPRLLAFLDAALGGPAR